jgi:RNA polymerase sigma-70 factor (ECF subfamily)
LTSDDDPAQAVQYIFEQARVRDALQQIPAEQRIVIELAFWGGLTQREIAVYCHSPLGTIKTRSRLGMQRLKRLLPEPV